MDWLVFGILALGLIAFFMFVNNGTTVTGRVVGTAFNENRNCYSFDSGLPVMVTQPSLRLCPNTTHAIDYFSIQTRQVLIDCQGSTLQGSGGALLVVEGVNHPRVTLLNCSWEGFDGLYSRTNPIDVYVK